MTKYRAIYKCRMCGEEFERGAMPSADAAIENMVNITYGYMTDKYSKGMQVKETFMHSCKDGSLGLSDFLGFKEVWGKNEPN